MSMGTILLLVFIGFCMMLRKHGGKMFRFALDNQDTIRRIVRRR